MKRFFTFFTFFLLGSLSLQAQVTTIDFETINDGYTPTGTAGSGFTDVFNRANPNIGGNATFMWAVEDLPLVNPSIDLDQINVAGSSSFTFSIDMLAHHFNDWDVGDDLLITYSLDGGASQNLIWIQNDGATFNSAASLDTDFDGDGDCGSGILPALTTGTSGCVVSLSNFQTFITGSIALSSNTTLDIKLQFNGLDSTDEGIYLDNIVITETVTSSNDTDTEIIDPVTQIAAGNIASTVDNSGAAVDVFRMNIEDQGSGDALATKVTNIRIKPALSNTADWTDHIQGIVIEDGVSFLTPSSVNITDTEIDIVLPSTELNIADGGNKDVTIAIFLNTSNIVDNSIFSCFVDADAHGFTADASGSAFVSTFTLGDVVSNNFNIQVDATALQVQTQPSNVAQNNIMSPVVTVAYADANGNVDVDYDGLGNTTSVTTTGTFDGTATTTVAAVAGIASFSNLVFSAQGTGLTLTASDISGLLGTSVVSGTFDVTAPSAAAGDIVINEYMANPTCEGDAIAEYVELYNTTGAAIDIAGWTLEDDGSDGHTFNGANGTTTIAADGYLICGIDAASSSNPDYDYASFTLSNSGDEIVLKDGATEICRVNYSNGDQFGAGISVQLPSNYDYALADDGVIMENEYIEPNTTYGCGDFGTPGATNALPIKLQSFTATKKANTTLLQWQTATEINNDYMAIERSNDGRTFTAIGQVQGAGTSYEVNNYSLVDEKPNTGINYYRLRQVDYDGKAQIHRTISVIFGKDNGTVQVFPTEVATAINVVFPTTTTAKTELVVVDVTGKEWLRTTLSTGQSQYTLDVSSLVSGQFFLRIQSETGVEVARFVKL